MCHMKILGWMVLFDKGETSKPLVMPSSLPKVQIPQHSLVFVLTIIPLLEFVGLVQADQSHGRKGCKYIYIYRWSAPNLRAVVTSLLALNSSANKGIVVRNHDDSKTDCRLLLHRISRSSWRKISTKVSQPNQKPGLGYFFHPRPWPFWINC